MNLLIRVAVNAAALAVAAWLLDGIRLTDRQDRVLTLLGVAVVFGLINTFIAPIIKLLSLPFIVLTLGLFTFVVNALMLQITEWIGGALDLSFGIDHFWWDAVMAAVVITLVSWVLSVVLPDDD